MGRQLCAGGYQGGHHSCSWYKPGQSKAGRPCQGSLTGHRRGPPGRTCLAVCGRARLSAGAPGCVPVRLAEYSLAVCGCAWLCIVRVRLAARRKWFCLQPGAEAAVSLRRGACCVRCDRSSLLKRPSPGRTELGTLQQVLGSLQALCWAVPRGPGLHQSGVCLPCSLVSAFLQPAPQVTFNRMGNKG